MYQTWIRQFSSYLNSILHCFMYQAWIRQFSLAISIVFYTVSCIRSAIRQFSQTIAIYQQYFTLFHVSGLDKTIQSSYINSILHCFMYQAWIKTIQSSYINSILHCFMYQAWIRQFSLAITISIVFHYYFTLFHVSVLDKTIQSSYINSILHCFMYQAWIRQFSLAISIVYSVSCISPG